MNFFQGFGKKKRQHVNTGFLATFHRFLEQRQICLKSCKNQQRRRDSAAGKESCMKWQIKRNDGEILCECDSSDKATWIVDTLNESYPGQFTLCSDGEAF